MTSDATLTIRIGPDRFDTSSLRQASIGWLESALQLRLFKQRKKQRHFSGTYWSTTMSGHVGYESRLELGSLQLADFDPEVVRIQAQPFQLSGRDGPGRRRHVPDYLLKYADGHLCVVDVKSRNRLQHPKVVAQFDWTRALLEARGWEYRVESELDPVLLRNLRFLAGYRRTFQFDPDSVAASRLIVITPTSFADAVRRIAPLAGGPDYARGIVLHLLWSRRLFTDLAEPLQATSIIAPEPV